MKPMDTTVGVAIPPPTAHPELWDPRNRHTSFNHNPSLKSEEEERYGETVRVPGSLNSVHASHGAKAQSTRPGIKRGKR